MNSWTDSVVFWLADFYLLSVVLCVAALAASALLRQPAQRLAVAKAASIAIVLLAVLCALPGWSTFNLATSADSSTVDADRVGPPSAPTAAEVFASSPDTAKHDSSVPATAALASAQHVFWRDLHWPSAALSVFGLGSLAVTVWLALGVLAVRRLVRDSTAAPDRLLGQLQAIVGSGGAAPRLMLSDHVETAVALGVLRPTVLLPRAWATRQPVDALATVLAHEWTHIRNGDLRWLAIGRGLLLLLWAQPLYWWLRRQMGLDQEALADAVAAEVTNRRRYSEQLVAWARNVRLRRRIELSPAVGLWEGPSQLRRRIAILLDERLEVLRVCTLRWRITVVLVLAATAVGLSAITLQPAAIAADEPEPVGDQSDNQNASDAFVPFGVTATKKVDAIQTGMSEPNVVAGQLKDENDQPLSGAEVTLFLATAMDAPQVLLADVRTDRDGRFRFDVTDTMKQLFPDSKAPSLHDFQPDPPVLKMVARSRGRVTMEHSILAARVGRIGVSYGHQMAPGATLRGRITGPDGKPVEGTLVSVSHLGTRTSGGANSAHTDADGRYIIDDVAPFDHAEAQRQEQAQLEMQRRLAKDKESATLFWVGPTAMQVSVEHPDFAIRRVRCLDIPGTRDVQLEPAAAITGRVVDADGAPVPSAKVWLANSRPTPEELAEHGSPPPFDDAGNYLHHFETANTDAAGRYRFANLPANAYELWVEWNDWQYPGVERIVAAAGRSIDAPDFVVTKGGTIRVRLVDDATGQPVPLDGDVQARFTLPSDPFSHRGVSRPIARPADGAFVLDAYPGEFRIFCDYVMHNGQLAWLSATGSIEDAPRVRVVDSETIDVDLRVKQHEPPRPTELSDAASEQLQQAWQLVSDGRFQEAVDLANVIIKENYPAPDAWLVRAEARAKLGQIRALLSEYELLLDPERELPKTIAWVARNNLAYVLATTADERLRDGPRAVHLAEEAIRLAGDRNFQLYDTLAAAHAETGDFQRAVATQHKAIELAPAAVRRTLIDHLTLYQAGQPLREPPAQPAEVVNE